MVTINSIREGVIAALEGFFPDTGITGEESEGGEVKPYFFVMLKSVKQTKEIGQRYHRTHSLDINYHAEDGKNSTMHDMAESLYDLMELIEIESIKYKGTNMSHEIIEGVLHFYVDYNFHVSRQAQQEPLMNEIKQEGFIKNG